MEDTANQAPIHMEVKEHLYDLNARFTRVIDFGIKIKDLLANPDLIPPQGARFNFEFEGNVTGKKINGKIKGVDYGYMRPDGCARMHIRAVITTDTGVNIDLSCEGITYQSEDPTIYNIRESIYLFTENPEYKWVNKVQIWARGSSDLTKGEINLRSFIA